MKRFKFKKIDAFATEGSAGNPAGFVWLENKDAITPDEMLQIARELKGFVTEVGFAYWGVGHQVMELKYYSAEREVDFCGHATIAMMNDLFGTYPALRDIDSLAIHTNRGKLMVENRLTTEGAVFIMSPEPLVHNILPKGEDLAKSLNIDVGELDGELPVSIINAGLTTLLVPIKRLESVLAMEPDLLVLKEFCVRSAIDIIEVFTGEVSDASNHYRARVFAPTFGYLEDPATGSGNSAFGYYLIAHGLWKGETVCIEQNGSSQQFNIVKLQQRKDDKGNIRVLFGGGAITRIEGEYLLR